MKLNNIEKNLKRKLLYTYNIINYKQLQDILFISTF